MTSLEITTPYGTLEGFRNQAGCEVYLGIPFAKPPVGALRWKAPQELDKSNERISCKVLGCSAMQKKDPVMAASMREQSEDCLTANVWVRDHTKKNQPVMVFIHGGAYLEGGSSDPLYDGTQFCMRNDVVFVSFNYRVNIFGFMNFASCPGGEDFQESGYLGSLDQLAALRWVHSCIEQFGGDPDNVTLFGESCGSGSTALLSTTKEAPGKLYQKAICESGPLQLYNAPEITAPYAQEFMEMAGCRTMDEMMKLSSQELIDVYSGPYFDKHIYEVSLITAPTCDGRFFPRKPLKAFKEGSAKDIKLMIGTNEDEFRYWSLYFKDISKEMPLFWHGQSVFHFDGLLDDAKYEAAYVAAHPGENEVDRYIDYTNQIGFYVGSELMAEYQSAYNDAYLYLFRYKSKIPGFGSCHAVELPFVMHNIDDPNLIKGLTGERPPEHLADEVQDAWVAFARTGQPGNAVAPTWRKYQVDDRATMVMDDHGWEVADDPNKVNREILRPAFDECLINAQERK